MQHDVKDDTYSRGHGDLGHSPFSIYARAQQVYIDGALLYDRLDPAYQPVSDFELGILPAGGR